MSLNNIQVLGDAMSSIMVLMVAIGSLLTMAIFHLPGWIGFALLTITITLVGLILKSCVPDVNNTYPTTAVGGR